MKEVQRWECRVATNANGRPYVDDIEFAAGRYVLYSDHKAEIVRLRAEVEAVRKDALQIAQTLAWQCFGECRGFSDGLISTHEALAIAIKIKDAMGASA